jgi:hypothetical protein
MFLYPFIYLFDEISEDLLLDETKLSQRHNDASYHRQLNNFYASIIKRHYPYAADMPAEAEAQSSHGDHI